jgi:hypothetical protein
MNQPEHTAARELKRQMDEAIEASEREIARAIKAIKAGRSAFVSEYDWRQAVGRVSSEP